MGFGGISIWQLLIILLIVVLIFGTKKLKGLGNDLGGAVKGFKDAMSDGKDEQQSTEDQDSARKVPPPAESTADTTATQAKKDANKSA